MLSYVKNIFSILKAKMQGHVLKRISSWWAPERTPADSTGLEGQLRDVRNLNYALPQHSVNIMGLRSLEARFASERSMGTLSTTAAGEEKGREQTSSGPSAPAG